MDAQIHGFPFTTSWLGLASDARYHDNVKDLLHSMCVALLHAFKKTQRFAEATQMGGKRLGVQRWCIITTRKNKRTGMTCLLMRDSIYITSLAMHILRQGRSTLQRGVSEASHI